MVLVPLEELHGPHRGCTFAAVFAPPLETGTTWSMVSGPSEPQARHRCPYCAWIWRHSSAVSTPAARRRCFFSRDVRAARSGLSLAHCTLFATSFLRLRW